MSNRTPGQHHQGPILASDRASGGLLDDVPIGVVNRSRSPYKTLHEDFGTYFADAQLTLSGAVVTDIGSPTSPSEVSGGVTGGLFINPGSKVDSGVEIQWKGPGAAAGLNNAHQILGTLISTTTAMDGRELFFEVRLGIQTNLLTANDGKWLLGFFVEDTSVLSNTTGLPLVPAGGGFGFHKGETGLVTALCTPDAITAAGTAGTLQNQLALSATSTYNYFKYGARARWVDADATSDAGMVTYYINDAVVQSTAYDTMPFDSTETFHFTFAAHNGPVQIQDYILDYVTTGITRPGLTYPYATRTAALNYY